LLAGGKSKNAQGGLIDKSADAMNVNTVNALGSGFENQADAFFLVGKALFDFLALSIIEPRVNAVTARISIRN